MSIEDIAVTAGQLIEQASDSVPAVIDGLQNAGGFLGREGGKIALGVLIREPIARLFESIKEKKREGKIPEDFDSTPHGAKLLQEALNGLLDGKTEEQAEAVREVFLRLAQTDTASALERIEQIHILETVAALTPWQLETFNLAERYRVKYYDRIFAADYAKDEQRRGSLQQEVVKQGAAPTFESWLNQVEGMDPSRLHIVRQSCEELWKLDLFSNQRPDARETRWMVVLLPHGILGRLGAKVALYLYSTAPAP